MPKFEQITPSNKSSISACELSPSAFVDLIFLIAVIGAIGYLIHPYATLVLSKTLETLKPVLPPNGSVVYGVLGLVVLTTSMAMLAITLLKSSKCDQPGCRGLKKSVNFDICIEMEREDCVKNRRSVKYGLKKGLLDRLPRDYVDKLEVELKKMAPVDGRAVIVFRGRCGCPIVRLEVAGAKKKKNRTMRK